MELFLQKKADVYKRSRVDVQPVAGDPAGGLTSWPISMAHSLADWSLASTITLNMVHNVGETRKSVDLLLLASLDSNAILVLEVKSGVLLRAGRRPLLAHRTTDAPLDAVLDHVAGHELDAALQVFGELLLRPVQVPDEGLQRVQLPEQVLRRPRAVAAGDPNTRTDR